MASTPCTNCGTPVEAGGAACANCGTAAPPAPPTGEATTAFQVPAPPPPGAPAPQGGVPAPGQQPAPPPPPGAPSPPGGVPAPGQQPAPPPGAPAPQGGFPAQPAHQQPAAPPPPGAPANQQPVAPVGGAPGPQPAAAGRNRTAGILALAGVAVVLIGTFLPIVELDTALSGGVEDSLNGWSGDINDGPIHLVVGLVPLAMGILVLKNRTKTWVKVLLIVSAVIGFLWIAVRFADISGSLEEDPSLGDLVAEVTDPGIGLYAISLGWLLVLVAGIMAKSEKAPPAFAPYAQAYPPPPA